MPLGYDKKIYIMAFDHRGSFIKLFGRSGTLPPGDTARVAGAKMLIFEGLQRAVAEGAPRETAGVLVDEQFGAEVARKAKREGYPLAMPVEKSGQDEFDFEYGDEFGKHIEEFDPNFSKVLVRYNPDGDREMNATQIVRLQKLCDWLHERGRKFLFELLVPAEPDQLKQVGGDEDRYDKEVRPGLMMEAIEALQDFGVEPDIWKIEGVDEREDCRRIAELCRRDRRDGVSCVVLGRGASDEKVDEWLRAGAGVPGYIGFAIGRSIFGSSVKSLAAREGEREELAEQIARNYLRFIDVYQSASVPA